MRKYTLLAGSHVIGDRVFMAGDEVPSDDDLPKLFGRLKFSALPEPEVVYVEATTTQAPEVAPEPEVATEAVEAPKMKKAK